MADAVYTETNNDISITYNQMIYNFHKTNDGFQFTNRTTINGAPFAAYEENMVPSLINRDNSYVFKPDPYNNQTIIIPKHNEGGRRRHKSRRNRRHKSRRNRRHCRTRKQ
jgi:hypothetical protein